MKQLILGLTLLASMSSYAAQSVILCKFAPFQKRDIVETIKLSLDVNDSHLISYDSGALNVKNWDDEILVELYDTNSNRGYLKSELKLKHQDLRLVDLSKEFVLKLETEDKPTATCQIIKNYF